MNDTPNQTNHIEHGEQCSCTVLALATGLDPRKLTFAYCHGVLHKRWSMTCRHGEHKATPVPPGLGEHWHDVRSVDSVKAILISNDQ